MSDSLWPHTPVLCPWNSPDKNTGVGSHSLLQVIFQTQGSNPGLLYCRQILYHLSHQGSPIGFPKEGSQSVIDWWAPWLSCLELTCSHCFSDYLGVFDGTPPASPAARDNDLQTSQPHSPLVLWRWVSSTVPLEVWSLGHSQQPLGCVRSSSSAVGGLSSKGFDIQRGRSLNGSPSWELSSVSPGLLEALQGTSVCLAWWMCRAGRVCSRLPA